MIVRLRFERHHLRLEHAGKKHAVVAEIGAAINDQLARLMQARQQVQERRFVEFPGALYRGRNVVAGKMGEVVAPVAVHDRAGVDGRHRRIGAQGAADAGQGRQRRRQLVRCARVGAKAGRQLGAGMGLEMGRRRRRRAQRDRHGTGRVHLLELFLRPCLRQQTLVAPWCAERDGAFEMLQGALLLLVDDGGASQGVVYPGN